MPRYSSLAPRGSDELEQARARRMVDATHFAKTSRIVGRAAGSTSSSRSMIGAIWSSTAHAPVRVDGLGGCGRLSRVPSRPSCQANHQHHPQGLFGASASSPLSAALALAPCWLALDRRPRLWAPASQACLQPTLPCCCDPCFRGSLSPQSIKHSPRVTNSLKTARPCQAPFTPLTTTHT